MSRKQLAILIPAREFDTSIGPITLKPFPLKHWNKVFDMIDRYKALFHEDPITVTGKDGKPQTVMMRISIEEALVILLQKAGENYLILKDLGELISLCSGVEVEKIEELQYDEIGSLLMEIIDQNGDFFRQIGAKINGTETPEAEETPAPEAEAQMTGAEESPV
ncbi:hypothetical protein V0288_11275 [Pannus brasiliensis CCIBt3594]|uniref:Tail assembly chaperone n=1 Tax=Pannus brasiliensis CCIBt3594 TaxID=1427578 RepID=A0AAW9QUW6_9CHRO